MVERQIDVGDGLRLHALRGVDDQQRALARREAARHLVAEVDVTRRIDQVELILPPVARAIGEPHGARLDRDAPLPLDVHRVEELLLPLALGERAGLLEQAVGERRLAVVDVGDDGEIADVRDVGHRDVAAKRSRS